MDYRTYQDYELTQLLLKDDELAFTEIYNRYWKFLYLIVYKKVKDLQATEDILHDAFASVWRNRNKAEISHLQNYLVSITKYLVFARIRKTKHELLYRQSQHYIPLEEFDMENALHNKQLLQFVQKEVDALPEKCRHAFKYSRDMGMSAREIADKMKITPKTVENHIHKALSHLRFSIKKRAF